MKVNYSLRYCVYLLGILICTYSYGQITYPQTPTFQYNFPPTPQFGTPNNSSVTTPTGGPKIQPQPDRRKQLEDVYNTIQSPKKSNTENVIYELPSCSTVKGTEAYREAFAKISDMASGKTKFSVKEATFLVENAYYENVGNYQNFDKAIKHIGQFLKWKMNDFNYSEHSNLAKNLMLFRFFTDTLEVKSKNIKHYPIQYDFEDYEGQNDWSKMFVSKLLRTNTGQCHSLPLLYLILADEINAKAQLVYSPSHLYIKFQDDNTKWHNLELTNGMLTTDAFVIQSGYVKAEALQNKIYMQTLSEQQLISLFLFDLAKGYAVKYCYDDFVLQVINKALELDSNNINAHLVLSDYLTLRFHYVEAQLGINRDNYKEKLNQYPKAREIFLDRNKQYAEVDEMGYENMPSDVYANWLNSLKDYATQQQSQQILQDLNTNIPLKK